MANLNHWIFRSRKLQLIYLKKLVSYYVLLIRDMAKVTIQEP